VIDHLIDDPVAKLAHAVDGEAEGIGGRRVNVVWLVYR
jgi:hypothetical protein